MHTDLVRISFETDAKQIDKLFVRDILKIDFQEVVDVVIFTVHLKNKVNLLSSTKEALPIILSHTRLYGIVDKDLFVECLGVLSVILGLQADALFVELVHVKLRGHLVESKSDDFVVSLLKELLSILISQLDESELP